MNSNIQNEYMNQIYEDLKSVVSCIIFIVRKTTYNSIQTADKQQKNRQQLCCRQTTHNRQQACCRQTHIRHNTDRQQTDRQKNTQRYRHTDREKHRQRQREKNKLAFGSRRVQGQSPLVNYNLLNFFSNVLYKTSMINSK